jgi:hypothetical protein
MIISIQLLVVILILLVLIDLFFHYYFELTTACSLFNNSPFALSVITTGCFW